MMVSPSSLLLLLCVLLSTGSAVSDSSSHTNNWAVLVCASRYWFNYRHIANVLSMYRSVKRLGIPDSNIILMLADDMACNARNPRPATVFNNAKQHINVYGDEIEVDYRGYEVTVENFLRVLTGRLDASIPSSKRLLSDDRSNILVYMTGHGGDGFLKFQDAEEISNHELGDAFEQMRQKQRYNELLFLIDTCQAGSMLRSFYSPGIVGCGSSSVSEDSLSHHMDSSIGVHVIDRWTFYALEFLERVNSGSKATLQQFFDSFDPSLVRSTPQVRKDLFTRPLSKVLLTDFFGSVRGIELLNSSIPEISYSHAECQEGCGPDHMTEIPPVYMANPWDMLKTESNDHKVSRGPSSQIPGVLILLALALPTLLGIYNLLVHSK